MEAVPPGARGWMEAGGTLGLIAGLSYGCLTLWKELQKPRRKHSSEREAAAKEMAALNREIYDDWKTQRKADFGLELAR